MCALSLLHICFPCKIKFSASFYSIFSTVFTFHAIALCVCHLMLSLLGFWGVLGGLWLLWVRGQLNSGILRGVSLFFRKLAPFSFGSVGPGIRVVPSSWTPKLYPLGVASVSDLHDGLTVP